MTFDTKVAVLLRDDLQPWQELNITAFVVSGIVGAHPDLIGEPYIDADGRAYNAMLVQPVLVLVGDGDALRAAHAKAVARELTLSVFTAELFSTGNDADNRAAVAAVRTEELDLVGIAVRGPRNVVDRLLKGARMHP